MHQMFTIITWLNHNPSLVYRLIIYKTSFHLRPHNMSKLNPIGNDSQKTSIFRNGKKMSPTILPIG